MPLFTPEQAEQFRTAKPFPHIVVDDFWFHTELERVAAEFPAPTDPRWKTYPDPKEYGKRAMDNPDHWGVEVSQMMAHLRSPAMCQAIEELTGYQNVTSDALGGGMHMTGTDGRLDMHVDFNVHPDGQRLRKINLLVFMNESWSSEWGGTLYLGENKEASIYPGWNRTAIFECSDISWHGHPDPIVGDHWRKSLACYYYVPLEQNVPAHTTNWLNG